MKEKIVLIGGGGHCHSVIDVIEQTNKYEIIGIVDIKKNIGKKVLDYEIIACDDDLEELFKTCKKAVITIGHIKTNELRKKLFEKAKNIGFDFPTIISPLAYVSKYSFIDRKSTRLNSSHQISYAVFCLKKKKRPPPAPPRRQRAPPEPAPPPAPPAQR